ncbi:MAG: enoyl-CoA hydratase-related protein, partial [Acidimicrobiales bacterium]|nr:enoyl-CoA hydratase-related protein [Acidimicrobiales bacterium]
DREAREQLLGVHAATRDARVVVLTGAEGHFCAGADLSGVEDAGFTDLLRKVLGTLRDDERPHLAAVDGAALGAGTQLAIACDLRVATASARFGIPAARLGLLVDHWSVERLSLLAGAGATRAMLLGAETYGGEDALGLGLVQRLGDLEAALGWADEIAALAPLTLAGLKVSLNRLEMPVGKGDDADVLAAWDRAWASADLQEGIAAFRERRRPVFHGR